MNGLNAARRIALISFSALICATLALSVGCVSQYARRLDDVRRDYYDFGDVDKAKDEIQRGQKRAPKKEQDLLTLNAASLELADGDFKNAKAKLRQVRDSFDLLESQRAQKTAEGLLSYWTDDNMNSYEGEDYEKIMVRAELAIADLFDGGQDAKAYAYQIAAKQDEIVKNGTIDDPEKEGKKKNPKTVYPRVPLGPYIEGLVWEETYTETAEAARCYEKVVKWRPDFKQGKTDLVRVQTSVHSKPGFGRVYVFAFVGRGPKKEQVYEPASQISLLIADQIFSAVNKYSVPPTLAPVPIPALVTEEPRLDSVVIDVDGERKGQTETITDVNEMALKQFNAVKDQILARAVVRRVVKKGTIYAAKEVGQVNPWVSLAADVGGVVWEATETADTRCWGLLPAKIQVASFELPVGEHKIATYPNGSGGAGLGEKLEKTIRVDANRNTYVLVNYPDRKPIGRVVSSDDVVDANAPEVPQNDADAVSVEDESREE